MRPIKGVGLWAHDGWAYDHHRHSEKTLFFSLCLSKCEEEHGQPLDQFVVRAPFRIWLWVRFVPCRRRLLSSEGSRIYQVHVKKRWGKRQSNPSTEPASIRWPHTWSSLEIMRFAFALALNIPYDGVQRGVDLREQWMGCTSLQLVQRRPHFVFLFVFLIEIVYLSHSHTHKAMNGKSQ